MITVTRRAFGTTPITFQYDSEDRQFITPGLARWLADMDKWNYEVDTICESIRGGQLSPDELDWLRTAFENQKLTRGGALADIGIIGRLQKKRYGRNDFDRVYSLAEGRNLEPTA